MNILVTGATGFVASQLVTDLLAAGHSVTCCVRNTDYALNLFPQAHIIRCNFIKDTAASDWIFRLNNIDIVINCVGIFYHPNKKIMWAIHYKTPRALFDAATKVGVKKIIHISALGVDKSEVEYAKSKKAADDYLQQLSIKSVILRPSLVYGRGSYGGTSLFRGLAGLPGMIPVPGKGIQEFQPIHVQDLSKAILKLMDNNSESKLLLPAVGQKRINLRDLLIKMRSWLGFTKAKIIFFPLWLIRAGTLLGNLIPYSAVNSTAYKLLSQNNVASGTDAKKFHETIGFVPRTFVEGLYSQPSTVQDHWHARLFFLKPLLQLSIAFVWLFSAICSAFIFPKASSFALLGQVGITESLQPFFLYGACLLNTLIGLAVLVGFEVKKVGILQIIIIVFYSVIISWKLPYFLFQPFGPIAKNIPLIVAILIMMAMESDR